MATFTSGGAYSIRMDHLDTNELWRGHRTVQSLNLLQIEIYQSDFVSFYGSGLTYYSNGAVTGGTVTGLSEVFQGIAMFSISGLNISAASLYARAFTRDSEGFKELLFAKNDKISGTGFNDYLMGYAGKDIIKAGGGKDTLAGGEGNDILTGGKGKDTFVFDPSDRGFDRITDFSVREDIIHIDRTGGRAKVRDDAFVLGDHALDGADRVIYDPSNGNIYYDADGSGTKGQVLLAKMKPWLSLTVDSFLLI